MENRITTESSFRAAVPTNSNEISRVRSWRHVILRLHFRKVDKEEGSVNQIIELPEFNGLDYLQNADREISIFIRQLSQTILH